MWLRPQPYGLLACQWHKSDREEYGTTCRLLFPVCHPDLPLRHEKPVQVGRNHAVFDARSLPALSVAEDNLCEHAPLVLARRDGFHSILQRRPSHWHSSRSFKRQSAQLDPPGARRLRS